MGVFNNWPYTDVHQLNLDFILDAVKDYKEKAEELDTAVETATTAAENAETSAQRAEISKNNALIIRNETADYYELTRQLVGKPLAANTAAEMIDTTTIYIYTGDEEGYEPGHWYYYDGSAWQDGGVYGADGGINTNARNLLKYILEKVVYTQTGMQPYVNALYEALAESGGTTSYMIINALTNATNSNTATGCNEGDSYTATLTADTGYTLSTVTVTMGGIDVTSTVYSNGTINIASVTGDIVITAVAIADNILFQILNQTYDGTQTGITTDIQLLSSDRSYSVLADFNANNTAQGSYVTSLLNPSTYQGTRIEYGAGTTVNDIRLWLNGGAFDTSIPYTSNDNIKVIFTHTLGDKFTGCVYMKNGDTRPLAISNGADIQTTGTGVIRAVGSGFAGTINNLTWYDGEMPWSTIRDIFGLGPKQVLFERGTWSSGNLVNSTTRVRSFNFIQAEISNISTTSNYEILLYAWQNGTYIGWWNGSGFGSGTSIFLQSINMASYRASYPNYDFKILVRNATDPSTTLTLDEAYNNVTFE